MTILFVGEWLLRSCLLILCGAVLVKLLPVKAPAARLAAWTALLAASLAIPILNAILPQIALAVVPAPARRPIPPAPTRIVYDSAPVATHLPIGGPVVDAPAALSPSAEAERIDWARLAVVFYFFTAGLLLFRLFTGALLSLRLCRRSRPTGKSAGGAEVRESREIASPATIGVLRPVVLLPPGWRHWHAAKLAAVLAHEGSHIRRRDPAIQFVSAIHRAILWASPASWLLDRAIVRCAEQISDDDAIAATRDPVSYAETLLEFFQHTAGPRHSLAVPMARYDRPEKRIRRILRSSAIPGRFSRPRLAAFLLAGAPLAYLAAAAHPQSAGKDQPAFDIADVHYSPRSEWVKSQSNPLQGGYLAGDRYELRRATMLDLIRLAYNKDAGRIYGGPSWIDYDRFEIAARTKTGTSPETLQRMLQTLLQERFHLMVKEDTRPAPAYVLSRGKGELKMKAASANPSGECKFTRNGTYGETFKVECRNVSIEQFAEAIRPRLAAYPRALPVVDSTGLKGGWDFDLEIPVDFGSTVARAVDKLGLKCEKSNAPQPVLVVENVSEQPTPNPPEVAAKLPPQSPPAFEVASLKATCTGPSTPLKFEAGGRVTGTCMSLGLLIVWAWNIEQWDLDPSNRPFGLPEKTANQMISLVAQAPPGIAPNPQHNAEARDVLYAMLRTLLIERYRMKLHYEDRPVDAATLVAAKPKLARADPSGRTGCTRESIQQTDRGAPVEYVCRNITMAQFAEQLRGLDPTLRQVEDATGLNGAWDFTLHFEVLATLNRNFPHPAGRAAADEQASEPSGALLLGQAIEKQLGLKLETRKRLAPVLVIDHIEPNPIAN